MKNGLVMEGGAMRGMFTAGVIDVFMENDIDFDGAVGVSAGAVFGCNIKSKQIGRVIRYNKNYCKNPEYVSFRSLIKTGNIYGTDFAYRRIPDELDVFDTETYKNNPMEFYVVCTDVDTGEPVYYRCDSGNENDVKWMRASASMPMLSQYVEIDGYTLSDGGTADSIPLKFFQSIGYDRNVVVLTQPLGFVKKVNRMLPLMRVVLRKKPKLIAAIANRHIRYNKTTEFVRQEEAKGNTLVIRPKQALNIGAIEHNPDELERVYQIGRAAATERLEEVKTFLA